MKNIWLALILIAAVGIALLITSAVSASDYSNTYKGGYARGWAQSEPAAQVFGLSPNFYSMAFRQSEPVKFYSCDIVPH